MSAQLSFLFDEAMARASFATSTAGEITRQNGANLLPTEPSKISQRGPLYVFAKRTHFIFGQMAVYSPLFQVLMHFTEAFANGFVLRKRTHFEGVGMRFGCELERELGQELITAGNAGLRSPVRLPFGLGFGTTLRFDR